MHVSFPSIWFAGRHPNGAVRTEHPNLKGGGGGGHGGVPCKGTRCGGCARGCADVAHRPLRGRSLGLLGTSVEGRRDGQEHKERVTRRW